jgi:chemotaxis methyl-accepting protein methylase
MLDPLTHAPPECVFGNFDLILCRNFVMYLDPCATAQVFDKLHKALAPHGVLMLGMVETPPERYAGYWEKLFPFGCLYRKAVKERRYETL